MNYNGLLQDLPRGIKWFIATFVLVLSIGFFTGLAFVNQTSTAAPSGIEENYLGNEDDTAAPVMKFKKSTREMLNIIHTHILSMSFIFFLLGGLVWIARLPMAWKLFLTIEPFISVLLTFGGIYLMWTGLLWMKYIVVFSGILMTLTYTLSAALVLYQLAAKQSSAIS